MPRAERPSVREGTASLFVELLFPGTVAGVLEVIQVVELRIVVETIWRFAE